jgi:general secretion pathway protein C
VSATAWFDELRSRPGWARLFEQQGPRLLVVVLLIALALDSALILTRALSHHRALAANAAPMAPPAARPAINPAVELASIVNAHLFGRAGVTGSDNAPLTTMPLILAGVIAGNDPNKGQAIIGESAASAKLYAVGAMISGGARLHSIFHDHVLIERNGGLETLKLPHTAPNAGPARPMAATPPTPPHTEAQRDNSTVLAGMVRVQPVFNQGKLSGYRIFPGGGRGNTAFTQLGLRSGDLIVAINGSPLDDAGRAMEVMQTLSSASSATVTVSRSGVTQEVNLNLANLNVDAESNPGDNAAAGAPGSDTAPAGTPGANATRGRVTPPVPTNGTPVGNAGSPSDAPPATEGVPGAAGANGERER